MDTTTKGAGYEQHLAQLGHQVSLLEERLHAARAEQQQHRYSSAKVRSMTQMRISGISLLSIGM